MKTLFSFELKQRIVLLVCIAAVVVMAIAIASPSIELFAHRPKDYLSIHLVVELISIIVAVMVVSIVWSGIRERYQAMAKPLIFGFTVIACVDLLHALTYEGMPSLWIDGSTEVAVFFWLAARSFEILTMILVVSRVSLPGSNVVWMIAGLVTVAGIGWLGIHGLTLLPTIFVPGTGVTPFKTGYEVALSAANLALAFMLFRQSIIANSSRLLWLGTACFIMGIGGLAFTSYQATSESLVMIGHFYKVAAYGFIYLATFLSAVQEPHNLLKRSMAKIQSKELELETTLRSMPVGVARLDSRLRVLYTNQSLFRMLETPEANVCGAPFAALGKTFLTEQLNPYLDAALGGHPGELEPEFTTPGGTHKYLHIVVKAEANDSGNDGGVLIIFTDITESEQNRRLWQASEQEKFELRTALDAHAIVAITDPCGVITEANDKFCAISQYSREELIGSTHSLIKSGVHAPEFFQELWRVISRGEVWSGEICNKNKSGTLYWVQSTIVPFIGTSGKPEQYIAIRADITARKEAEFETQRMALHDALTGLPNRRLMTDRLGRALHSKERQPGYGAVLLMDLDYFKEVNDTLGHPTGDELLRQIALRLTSCVRQVDTVARLGGDEFVIILDTIGANLQSALSNTANMGEKIRARLAEPYQLAGLQLDVTPSLGVVLFNDPAEAPEELVKQADIALYRAKEAGRNQVSFFDPSLQAETNERALLVRDLRQALKSQELTLFYQPIVGIHRDIQGVEALIRWRHPARGLIAPDKFIPLAEQSGLIYPVGEWVLHTACLQLSEWQADPERNHWTMAVNISAKQLNQSDFVDSVKRVLGQTGARADLLKLELTESMLQDNVDITITKMEALRQLGVRFSLDDFGTGYSSLSYLKRLPLDQLKIDKSFVDDIVEDINDAVISRTILALAESLGLSVVAEGVETVAQMQWLSDNGCKFFQGYLFSPPIPIERLDTMLAETSV